MRLSFAKCAAIPTWNSSTGCKWCCKRPDSDWHRIIKHAGLEPARVATDVIACLDRLPRGATAISDFSPHLEEAVERGWLYGSLLYNDTRVRTGHMLVGILRTPGLRRILTDISREFEKINGEELSDTLLNVVSGSPEDALSTPEAAVGNAAPGEGGGQLASAQMGRQEALGKFSVDLTEKARKERSIPSPAATTKSARSSISSCAVGKTTPSSPARRVGKTAVVEAFALRIAAGDIRAGPAGGYVAHPRPPVYSRRGASA